MTTRYIYTADRGAVHMDEDEYLRMLRLFIQSLVLIAEDHGFANAPAVVQAKLRSEDLLTHQRRLHALIKRVDGLRANDTLVNEANAAVIKEAKELIRCRVLACGLGGACNGVGTDQYPCPLKETW